MPHLRLVGDHVDLTWVAHRTIAADFEPGFVGVAKHGTISP
jgi:hypothetical protein